jgi:hypothetical protein
MSLSLHISRWLLALCLGTAAGVYAASPTMEQYKDPG